MRLGAAAGVVEVVAAVGAEVVAAAVLEAAVEEAVIGVAAACRALHPPSVDRHLLVDLHRCPRHRDPAALHALRWVRGQRAEWRGVLPV